MQVHRNQKPRNQKLMNEYAIKARTSDFRRRTSAGLHGRCMRRPRGWRVVASRGLELEVTIRGSGTLAAPALARHCEATGVSLPRKGRVHESVRGQSLRISTRYSRASPFTPASAGGRCGAICGRRSDHENVAIFENRARGSVRGRGGMRAGGVRRGGVQQRRETVIRRCACDMCKKHKSTRMCLISRGGW